MATLEQGFEIIKNLSESEQDAAILNNLGTSPIAQDLTLMRNNLRNISTVIVTNNNIGNNTVFFLNTRKALTANIASGNVIYVENTVNIQLNQLVFYGNSFLTGTFVSGINSVANYVNLDCDENSSNVVASEVGAGSIITFSSSTSAVFSNKTKVTVGSNTYYVKDSDGESFFSLSLNANLEGTVATANIPSGLYVRSDAVSKNNIVSFCATRRPERPDYITENWPYGFLFPYSTTVNVLSKLDENVNYFYFVKDRSFLKNRSIISTKQIDTDGVFKIKDPGGMNNTGLSNTSPGLFIYNPTTNTGTRAFSDSTNVWNENVGNTYLETTANQITVGTLYFNVNNLIVNNKTGYTLFSNNTNTLVTSSFNYKVPVVINGETYYLCLANN